MIESIRGVNYFEVPANTRIITVNCVGVMGAGLAKWFKDRYPDDYWTYRQRCNQGIIKIGYCDVIDTGDGRYVLFPTKLHWKNHSRLEYIEAGLIHLRELIKDDWIITVPPLGCGHGGLSFDIVSELIYDYLGDCKGHVKVVY